MEAPIKRSRRRFGPLFYTTTAVALLVIVSRPFWQSAMEQSRAWRLAAQLRDPTASTRGVAADGLVQLGPAATSWVIRAMRDNDPKVRKLACSILVRTAPARAEDALAALLVAAKDSDASVRVTAVGQLELLIIRHGSPPAATVREKALRALCDSLGDDSPEVRHAAGWTFWNLGPTARSVIDLLDRALDGPDKSLRVIVGGALLRVDPRATRARVIAAMSSMLTERSITINRFRLLQVLKTAQGEDATAAMIIPLLAAPDRGLRMEAIYELINQCPNAKALRSVLIDALASDDGGLRGAAALFFLEHEPAMAQRSIDVIAEQIVDPMDGSFLSPFSIKKIRDASAGSITLLTPKLVELLTRATKPSSRVSAIVALGEIGPDAISAVPALLTFSDSNDLDIATRAVASLLKIDPRAGATRLPSLLEWIKPGRDPRVRRSAMASLRDLGPAGSAAIPALLKVADEEDLALAAAAIEAISKIDPDKGRALKQAIARGELDSQND